jgi:hypothetical protein
MILVVLLATVSAAPKPAGREGDGCLATFRLNHKDHRISGTCTSQKDCSRPDSIQRKGFCPGSGDSIRCCIEAQEGLKDEPFDASKLDTEDRPKRQRRDDEDSLDSLSLDAPRRPSRDDDDDSMSLLSDDDTPKRRTNGDDDSMSLLSDDDTPKRKSRDDDSMSLLSDDDTPKRKSRDDDSMSLGGDEAPDHSRPLKRKENGNVNDRPIDYNNGEMAIWRRFLCSINIFRDTKRFDDSCASRKPE